MRSAALKNGTAELTKRYRRVHIARMKGSDLMKKMLAIGLVTVGLAGGLTACNTPGDRAAGGALIGGATGAAVGGLASGTAGGALAGGAIGAAGGAIVGAATAPQNCETYYYRGRRYQDCY
jgi:hypothetical protein